MNDLKTNYGFLFEKLLLEEMNSVCVFKEVKKGDVLIEIGSYVRSMPLLLSGAIKILRQDNDGNDLVLYYLEKGDTCAMTLSCCLGQKKSEIKAIAELDTTLLMIPIQKMEEWTSKYKTWRNFVFESYHNRLMEMLDAIDNLAFYNLEERLLKYLSEKSKLQNSNELSITHQQIADDLNTSRVVISRLLKSLERMKSIQLARNHIILLDN